jgi:hypothetical protein
MSTPATQTTTAAPGGNGRWAPPPPGTRSADQIKNDIVRQRHELSRSVDALRSRWARVTDVRAQVKEHKSELLVGAAVVGFLVGGAIALGRRRR